MKILVVDDHALVREGLCQVLQGFDPMGVTEVLQAATCTRALELAHFNRDLDLVLLDYLLPDMNGLAALEIFAQRHPELPVVILSGSANPSVVQQAMALGAAGFVTKSSLSNTLLDALRQILAGGIYQPDGFGPLSDTVEGVRTKLTTPPVLSPRQQDVLLLLLEGLTNRQICEHLSLGAETVKFHVSNILRIFGVSTRTQAALEAKRWGYDQASPARSR
ncbi:response regulator transcription factor [Rhodoferax sp.]|uniref:response regulator transcription factor n=1 Tax=Rhodoferax sp. TaxID=50421 RepID=UPI0025CC2517|nr:response regulator transcription factor [Rhodoferax sp.]MCM2297574.1 response regulator transcription factor [Rhodoferax sp.]MDD3935142.1 response regulator transcription factor [Rhodoferax sp.]